MLKQLYSDHLSYQAPYDSEGLLHFLAPRAIAGVEHITVSQEGGWPGGTIRRALRWKGDWIWIEVAFLPGESKIVVRSNCSSGEAALGELAGQVLDTKAETVEICRVLANDAALHPWIKARPGVRVPGAWDFFEMGVRAILGQQVTVKAAHTLAGRIAARFGTPIQTPWPEISLLWPEAMSLAACAVEELCELGLTRARAATVIAFAQHVAEGSAADLESIRGIGPWTSSYLALRSGTGRDAFPAGDLGIQKALGIETKKPALARRMAAERSQSWRPWRSYAVMLLWQSLSPAAKSAVFAAPEQQ